MVSRFISAVVSPGPEEIGVFGARGDGKTTAAFAAMVAHALEHQKAGYPLPTKWLGAADTFESHKRKTHESLMEALWLGTWRLEDGGHLAIFALNGQDLVRLHLFGVEDTAALARLRAQAHGLWFEEPAPASVMVQSAGLSETAWGMGITSCRMPSYRHPKIATLNYPDEEHWTAQRFVFDAQDGTQYFRIPAGELASAEQRAEWQRALANRPDMLRRLLQGQFGAVILGPQVAVGFNRDTHVKVCRPTRGFPVWIGQDGGHTPTCVIGQRVDGRVRILGSLTCEDWGMAQFIPGLLRPWLSEHTPWALEDSSLLHIVYDPSIDKGSEADINANALLVLQREFRGAHFRPGPTSWDDRRDALLPVLNAMHTGTPVLEIDPYGNKGLIRALDHGWFYAQAPDGSLRKSDTKTDSAQPKKPNHPHEDFGDSICYLIAGMAPSKAPRDPKWKPEAAVGMTFDPHKPKSWRPKSRGVGFNPLGLR